jgi:hypothetical protein
MIMCIPQVSAQVVWTVDDDYADFPAADFDHPQDAVNAAAPGDTILVYPGTYGIRTYSGGVHDTPDYEWGSGIWATYAEAPPLIVWKDGLTIRAVSRDPSTTVINSTTAKYFEPEPIQASTGGTWDGAAYVGAGVNPVTLSASNGVTILASDVTIKGFTIQTTHSSASAWTAGVMIGSLNIFSGMNDIYTGNCHSNVVRDCVFPAGQYLAVMIWHSNRNTIFRNTMSNASSENGSVLYIFDGFNPTQVGYSPGSQYNRVISNTITDNGNIFIGAVLHLYHPDADDPSFWPDHRGTKIMNNSCKSITARYSRGSKLFANNTLTGDYYYEYTTGVRIVGR